MTARIGPVGLLPRVQGFLAHGASRRDDESCLVLRRSFANGLQPSSQGSERAHLRPRVEARLPEALMSPQAPAGGLPAVLEERAREGAATAKCTFY